MRLLHLEYLVDYAYIYAENAVDLYKDLLLVLNTFLLIFFKYIRKVQLILLYFFFEYLRN